MPNRQKFWGWIVFILSIGAYVPVAIGGWNHPIEINMASYSIWLMISGMLIYSSHSQGFAGWRMPFGFLIGNLAMLSIGSIRGGFTFNLGATESIGLYGVVLTTLIWVIVGTVTRKWSNRILFLGGITADVVSYYPQLKQYILPHEAPTSFLLFGWFVWIIASLVNLFFVEEFGNKLVVSTSAYEMSYKKSKKVLTIIEESLFSIENSILVTMMVLVMLW